MAIWSSLRPSLLKCNSILLKNVSPVQSIRLMSGGHDNTMKIRPSRWQWNKFKDLIHLYTMLGLIPIGLLVFYVNVFIGPAKLAEIPEDYVPKHWEYHRHPITRFIARYLMPNPQQDYEKYLHQLYEEDEKMKMRKLQQRIMDLMSKNQDYQAYYYFPIEGKYVRKAQKEAEELGDYAGYDSRRTGPL